jgi:hypothetical protein
VIPEATDRALRQFLARRGLRKGDLSRFVDEAVHARLLDLTVQEVKERNATASQEQILCAIDEALDCR